MMGRLGVIMVESLCPSEREKSEEQISIFWTAVKWTAIHLVIVESFECHFCWLYSGFLLWHCSSGVLHSSVLFTFCVFIFRKSIQASLNPRHVIDSYACWKRKANYLETTHRILIHWSRLLEFRELCSVMVSEIYLCVLCESGLCSVMVKLVLYLHFGKPDLSLK